MRVFSSFSNPWVNRLRLFKRRINFFDSIGLYVSAISFASGGLSLKDKWNAFYLRIALEEPAKDGFRILKKRVKRTGSLIELRHKRFDYLNLEYGLLDSYQISICREFFLENIYDLSKINFVPEQIIDCGAFKGYFSIIASKRFPSTNIISIEPNPLNFQSIVKVIEKNSTKNLKNITPINKAISTSKDPIQLFSEGSDGSINQISTSSKYYMVDTIDVRELIDKEKPLLLKVDVEGAELEFFPDIINELPNKCFVFLETHDGWDSLVKIKQEFIKNGFMFEIGSERGAFIDSIAHRT